MLLQSHSVQRSTLCQLHHNKLYYPCILRYVQYFLKTGIMSCLGTRSVFFYKMHLKLLRSSWTSLQKIVSNKEENYHVLHVQLIHFLLVQRERYTYSSTQRYWDFSSEDFQFYINEMVGPLYSFTYFLLHNIMMMIYTY